MPLKERKTYFLYGEGRAPDVLCLGNLVLGSYANPTIASHYTHPPLSPYELKEHASSTTFENHVIHMKRGLSYGPQPSEAEPVDFDVSWRAADETFLTARAGTRIELKEPSEFLSNQVLQAEGEAEAKLRLWLSAANSSYILKMKWLRRPTIWMCTGLYLLEGTKVFTVSKKSVNAVVGINPGIINALSVAKIGGSVKIGSETSLTLSSTSEEKLVWAAQYRKLDVKYIRLGEGETAALPTVLDLYPDVASEGTLRKTDVDEANAVEIDVDANMDDETQENQYSVSEETYYKRLEEAIQIFEEELED